MDENDRRFALGIFFDGFGTLLLGVAMYLDYTLTMQTMLQEVGLVVIMLAVVVQWAAGLYFAVPAARQRWRGQ